MTLPKLRPWNIACRTAHIAAMSSLTGGHLFAVDQGLLLPWLYATILTGGILIILEAYPAWGWCCQMRGVMTIGKVLCLCLIPLFWDFRIAILAAVVVLGSVGSHMPKRYRNYSLIGS